jgi:hypothetical protein
MCAKSFHWFSDFLKKINQLYKNGHIIKIFTARYMGKHNGNVKLINKKYYKKTFNQMKNWGLNFHQLIMGKPIFDLFIDDKAYNTKDKKLNKEAFDPFIRLIKSSL